jgi:hypothetical protein
MDEFGIGQILHLKSESRVVDQSEIPGTSHAEGVAGK